MNNYARVIDIISNTNTDFRSLVIEAAKFNPGVIVKACERLHPPETYINERLHPPETYINECRNLVSKGSTLEAIKRWRAATGCSLKEAKEAVEAL